MSEPDALEIAVLAGDMEAASAMFYHVAWNAWHERFAGRVPGEDAVQEAVADCVKRAPQFDPERGTAATFFFYVSCSAMNAYWRWLNRKKRKLPVAHLEDEFKTPDSDEPLRRKDIVPAPMASPYEQLEHAEDLDRLATAMADLPSRERDTLHRRFWRKQKLREIGEDLGVTAERVRQIQIAAIKKLRGQVA